jgi:glycosyltransferase involved in cell wall biosynthesis
LKKDGRWNQGYCGIAYWPVFDVNEDYDSFPELSSLSQEKTQGKKIVLFVGRLERRKGIDLLLEATEAILEEPSALLVIAGRDTGGWTEKFKECAAKLGKSSEDRIVLLGEVSDATREKLLAHAYCLIFPSRYESFGLVPLEGFVHGTPAIASNSGAIPEVVVDGDCGLLYREEDANALASKVRDLLSDPKLRDRLSLGAKARVRKLSSRNSAIHSVNLYARLMRDNRLATKGVN